MIADGAVAAEEKAGKNFYQPGYSTTYADSPQVSADLQTQCNFKRKV